MRTKMHRRSTLPLVVFTFAAACDTTATGPDRLQRTAATGSFQTDGVPSEVECLGFLSGTFQNVVVPPGATCFLVRSTVTGNVKALERSSLTTNDNQIAGNVEASKASFVNIADDIIGGDVKIEDGVADPADEINFRVARVTLTNGNLHVIQNRGDVSLRFNTLRRGNLKVEDNVSTRFLALTNNDVAQNIQVLKNTGVGSKTVRANTAGSSIQCWENSPPFFAELNAAPVREGQCGPDVTDIPADQPE
jgi:hypothetical protein